MRFFLLLTLSFLSQLSFSQSLVWSPAEVIFSSIAQPAPPEIGGDQTSPCFDAKSGANNLLHITWSDVASGETEILYSNKENGSFSDPENISQTPQNASAWPSLAVGSGKIYCAWTEMSEDLEGGSIYVAQKALPNQWSTSVLASEPDIEPISIFPTVCVTSLGQVALAYNVVVFDEINIEYLFELRIKAFDPDNSTFVNLPSPQTDPSIAAFRPVLVADNLGGFHCLWYDGGSSGIPSGRHVAHSHFDGQSWGATTAISDASFQVWDDLPLQCLSNSAGDLTVLWTSFAPTENQMAVKPFGQSFQPSKILPFYTTDWDAAITQNGALHFVGDSQEGSLDYAYNNAGMWNMGTPLVSEQGETGSYPELIVVNDTLHLFWEEGGQMLYRTKPSILSGTSEKYWPKIKVSPNPCTNYLQIEGPQTIEGQQARIFDFVGRLISTQTIRDKNQINIDALAPGVYQLYIVDEENSYTQSFVKQ